MAARNAIARFTGFEPYKLTGVKVTDRELGHGSYATVQELEYMGLKCAGKKIHDLLLRQGRASYTVRRFEEECRLLSQVRHPNIVQFLGVHFQQRVRVPILVMEFLPTNLTSCIEQYGILPKEISYSILYDVALGLCYLHSQNPPIIHRDLSSNNVLLTTNMTAKISDLGVARILNLSPLQVSRMTETPGTPAYMPPEVMVANPKYDTSVDKFSYGILIIHVFSGKWPEPQVGPIRIDSGKMIPVSEAERREVFLQAVGNRHPLVDLIHRCINNDPQARPHTAEIVQQIKLHFPASVENRLELVSRIQTLEDEKRDVEERKSGLEEEKRKLNQEKESMNNELVSKNRVIEQTESEVKVLREQLQQEYKQKAYRLEIDQLKQVHSREVQRVQLQVRDLNAQIQLRDVEKNVAVNELKSKSTRYETIIGIKNKEINKLVSQLADEKETCQNLRTEVSKIGTLEAEITEKNAAIEQKDYEIVVKNAVLSEKDVIISGLNDQLAEARDFLTSKEQAVQTSIAWLPNGELPVNMSYGCTTIISSKIYYGGGWVLNDDNMYNVYRYDLLSRNWTTLPRLPVRYFGLGQVNGKLVAIGGRNRDGELSNKIYTFDEQLKRWKQTIPPMPTARDSPGVLSLESALVVAGGKISYATGKIEDYTNAVDIFKANTASWHRTVSLPTRCSDASLIAVNGTCYVIGGYNTQSLQLNQALYASVDDLLHSAVPANQTTRSGSSDTRSAWKTLPDTPIYRPTAAVLAGHLLALGDNKIYMYSFSIKSWLYIGNLPGPTPLSNTVVSVLSPTEILLIGGQYGKVWNFFYKGTLCFAPCQSC